MNQGRFSGEYEAHVGRLDPEGQFGHVANVLGIAVNQAGTLYATTALDQRVCVWNVDPPTLQTTLSPQPPLSGVYRYAIAFDPSGEFLVVSDDRDNGRRRRFGLTTAGQKVPQRIRVFQLQTTGQETAFKEVFSFRGHDDVIWNLSFDADGSRLVSCGQDGAIRVWDFKSARNNRRGWGKEPPVEYARERFTIVNAHDNPNAGDGQDARQNWVLCAKFSADGTQIISGGRDDHALKVWDVRKRQLEKTILGHRGSVTRICLSADGQRAFTACGDGLVRIWHLPTGIQKLSLAGHQGAVWGLDVFEKGGVPQRMVSSGDDGTVRIWDLNPLSPTSPGD